MSELRPFTELRYVGRRFEQNSLPIDFLSDVAVFQEVILETAKFLFLEKNPDRKRLPRGFHQSVEIHLERIDQGSAIVKLALLVSSVNQSPEVAFLEQARDTVIEAVNAAGEKRSVNQLLPARILSKFNKFGKNLNPDDAIELIGAAQVKARLDHATRAVIVFNAGSPVVERSVQTRAQVFELDQKEKTCKIEMVNGEVAAVTKIADESWDVIKAANFSFENKTHVLLNGTGKFGHDGKMRQLDIDTAELLDPLDIGLQLEQLSLLNEGWFDGDGHSYDKALVESLAKAFKTGFDETLPLPYIYPMPSGDIQFEWNTPTWTVSVDWAVKSESHYFFGLNKVSDQFEDHTKKYADASEALDFLNHFVCRFFSEINEA